MTPEEQRDDVLRSLSLSVSGYQCFGQDPGGFEGVYPINVIIGRNNSGKSTLLDLVEVACTGRSKSRLGKRSEQGPLPSIKFRQRIREELLGDNQQGRGDHRNKGLYRQPAYKGFWTERYVVSDGDWKQSHIEEESNDLQSVGGYTQGVQEIRSRLKNVEFRKLYFNPLEGVAYKRLGAERQMKPEKADAALDLLETGDGATNLIQRFANDADKPRELVKSRILDDLNRIFEPDASFTEIVTRRLSTGEWEVFLVEERKGTVALSRSGSGLQTVLLVLAFIHLVPAISDSKKPRPLSQFAFAFEELENNLHPALQRRLFLFLREVALKHGCRFFLTTHSSVVVNLFADDPDAQIVHVTHDGERAQATTVLTHTERRGVLDDLDVRASDLLQANGVVWVEGPTDRMYFNRWVELWSEGRLREGAHYQCVFYGGALLAHLSGEEPSEEAEAVEILRVNRNAIVLIDSDKKYLSAPLTEAKRRVRDEIEETGGMAWITKGREIEHYVPREAVKAAYGDLKNVDPTKYRFKTYEEYLNRLQSKLGDAYARSKVRFAEKVRPHIEREHLDAQYDLDEKLAEACRRIEAWNKLPAPAPA